MQHRNIDDDDNDDDDDDDNGDNDSDDDDDDDDDDSFHRFVSLLIWLRSPFPSSLLVIQTHFWSIHCSHKAGPS